MSDIKYLRIIFGSDIIFIVRLSNSSNGLDGFLFINNVKTKCDKIVMITVIYKF